jgi:hypothetical protein
MARIDAASLLDILLTALANSRKTLDQINQAAKQKGLPLPFPPDENGEPQIPGNTDYRFEGLGLIVGLPPKISFWVHYKPGSPDHVALGRFTVPIELGKKKFSHC